MYVCTCVSVAILAQGYGAECKLVGFQVVLPRMSTFALSEVKCLLFKLHRELLHLLCARAGKHYEGLSQAARGARERLGNHLVKKIRTVDEAVSIMRHITAERCAQLLREVEAKEREYTYGVSAGDAVADHFASAQSEDSEGAVFDGRRTPENPSSKRAVEVLEVEAKPGKPSGNHVRSCPGCAVCCAQGVRHAEHIEGVRGSGAGRDEESNASTQERWATAQDMEEHMEQCPGCCRCCLEERPVRPNADRQDVDIDVACRSGPADRESTFQEYRRDDWGSRRDRAQSSDGDASSDRSRFRKGKPSHIGVGKGRGRPCWPKVERCLAKQYGSGKGAGVGTFEGRPDAIELVNTDDDRVDSPANIANMRRKKGNAELDPEHI